jgi:hypothetical protein
MSETPVIESHDVVGMRVREDHGIDLANVFAQRLGSKICAGINHPGTFRCLNVDGRTKSLIARIRGTANSTIAPNHGNALGSASAEKSESELGVEG